MKMFKRTLKDNNMRVWAEYFWYCMGASGSLFFGLHKRRRISLLGKRLLASHERELVGW
jgi:hypothetical protein